MTSEKLSSEFPRSGEYFSIASLNAISPILNSSSVSYIYRLQTEETDFAINGLYASITSFSSNGLPVESIKPILLRFASFFWS